MTYRVKFSRAAGRNLASDQLPRSAIDAMLEFTYNTIAEIPYIVGEELHGEFEGTYRARRGPYRIRYAIDDGAGVITVHAFKHRGDAYYSGSA